MKAHLPLMFSQKRLNSLNVQAMKKKEHPFRGPTFGPLTADDVRKTQQGFRVQDAFPKLQICLFGFAVDPENPRRCCCFERWEGVNTESVKIGRAELPPTNADAKLPTHIMSLNWTPEGKIKCACLSNPLDRFEGTAKGAGAVLGLLAAAGVDPGHASVGDLFLRLQQRVLNSIEGFGRNWSVEADIPDWWKSKARGADPNDMQLVCFESKLAGIAVHSFSQGSRGVVKHRMFQ